jgi:hypothetical protein
LLSPLASVNPASEDSFHTIDLRIRPLSVE